MTKRVVCINDRGIDPRIASQPSEGCIYTVRATVFNGVTLGLAPKKGYLLEEVRNPEIDHPSGLGTFEPNFSIERFAVQPDPKVEYSTHREVVEA